MNPPSSEEIGKLQKLLLKNPIAFTAAFFVSFCGMLICAVVLLTRESADDQRKSADEWKKLYETERSANRELTNELLINNGIIREYREVAKKADSVITETQTSVKILQK
ncbi:hypothetical protein J2810_004642 [Chryseobacterium rhizosphaerae]|uniref:hypothetical protein n=1 Tax=Chryseobacterium rhizosphaerae TaxID=395937 RepID=UPI0028554EDD|nr:hypothetical protein [Chryseobacterium rhizosphaerae]MDR6548552.1 hypothetical protein [Chryseobacterium rhizosphaerae]